VSENRSRVRQTTQTTQIRTLPFWEIPCVLGRKGICLQHVPILEFRMNSAGRFTTARPKGQNAQTRAGSIVVPPEAPIPVQHKATTIAVACAADASYALPLAVMLNSLGAHLPADCAVVAYVLDDGVVPADRDRIAASLDARVQICWRRAASLPSGLPIWGRMPVTTYQKLLLGQWLPDSLRRAIWLDCDLLVLSDVSSLWRTASGPYAAWAVQDQRVPFVWSKCGVAGRRELGLAPGAKYFSAGVMVVELDRWRQENIAERSVDYLKKYRKKVHYWDQEALNAILAGQWGELDSRWNWHPTVDSLGSPAARRKHAPSEPWIVHFSGDRKPWTNYGAGIYWNRYYQYLDQTAWAGHRPARHRRAELVAWYETSWLRRIFYRAEPLAWEVVRSATREYYRENRSRT
jgi:lipopolysaccharide biosynthesis glycosyltransferase